MQIGCNVVGSSSRCGLCSLTVVLWKCYLLEYAIAWPILVIIPICNVKKVQGVEYEHMMFRMNPYLVKSWISCITLTILIILLEFDLQVRIENIQSLSPNKNDRSPTHIFAGSPCAQISLAFSQDSICIRSNFEGTARGSVEVLVEAWPGPYPNKHDLRCGKYIIIWHQSMRI
jgi:hypothetical protein